MTIKKLITVPDEVLRKKSQPIEKITNEEKKLVNDMFETMYHHKGIGLASIQVGIPKRIIVLDVSQKEEKKTPLCFINPIVRKMSSEKSVYTFIKIERPKTCLIEYIDIKGKQNLMECDNLLSTCIQHEINHLDGKLIIDYLSKLKKDLIIKKLSKARKNPDRIVV